MYSIIETAKANGLIPFNYIQHCLAQLSHPNRNLNSLSPYQVNPNKV
ncbi:transposase domain-containing protein [Shewanella sp. SG41-4]